MKRANDNRDPRSGSSTKKRNPPRAHRRRIPRQPARKKKRNRPASSGRLQKDIERRRIRKACRHLKSCVFKLFNRAEVEKLARSNQFYIRTPKEITAFEFTICCALASLVETKRGFASVWRMLSAAAGINVARSAVTQRFGKGSAAMLQALFELAIDRLPQWQMETPELLGKLKQFHAVLADDGCVVRLSPLLGKLFPASRTNKMDAALKVHARADLVHRSPRHSR